MYGLILIDAVYRASAGPRDHLRVEGVSLFHVSVQSYLDSFSIPADLVTFRTRI